MPATADPTLFLDPATLPTETLVAYVVDRFHRTHLDELTELVALAWRVETRHADHARCPLGLAEHLLLMFEDLEAHQGTEESVLFPRLIAGDAGAEFSPLARLQADHDDQLDQLRELRRVTRDYEAPEDACGSWRRLYALCSKFDADLREHVRIEQQHLFPRLYPEMIQRSSEVALAQSPQSCSR